MGICAAISAVGQAVVAVCTLLGTPEGQLAMKDCRENTAALERRIDAAAQWLSAQWASARANGSK